MNRFTFLTTGMLAMTGVTFVGCDKNESASSTGQTAGDKVDRAVDKTGDAINRGVENAADATKNVGDKLSNAAQEASGKLRGTDGTAAAPDAEGIRDVVAQVTEAALTEKGLDDLTERLVDADRNRIGSAVEADAPDHTALVKQFRADWKAKYGQDFNIKNEEAALPASMFKIQQGEIAKGAAGAEVEIDRKADGTTSVDVDRKTGVDAPNTPAADANRNDAGRNIATVSIMASHGLPSLSIPLIHEAPDSWKIDAPDTVDGAKLRSNVMAHLKAAHDMKDQWPANVQDGYAAVSHHVLMAILDQPLAAK